MKRLVVVFAAMAALGLTPATAQYLNTGGLMTNKDIVTPSDMFELSQTQFNFGTARSMAMAGAFTSLGADLSSMSINPAGLGMYTRSDVSITPLLTFERSTNSADAWQSNSKNRFSIGNFGFAINAYQGTGALTSLTVGFGYNRLADLNYSYSFLQTGNIGSIADMYSMQMQHSGLSANNIMGDNLKWRDVSTQLWPAVLGYKNGLTDDQRNNKEWSPTWIGGNRTHEGIDIGQYAEVVSRGSTGEFTLSTGANFNNKFYIGATLGIQSFYQRKDFYYQEDYTYPMAGPNPEGTAPDLDYQLLGSKLNQTVIVDGTGVNFKIGMVYRPINNVRLGIAFHTPTYYTFERKYQADMASETYINRSTDPDIKPGSYLQLNAATPVLLDESPYTWSFVGPSRLLFGASYMFGRYGILSVDYERTWYNGIRIKDIPGGASKQWYDDQFRTAFKGSNTLRIGLEVKPIPTIALRMGFGYSGSWLQEENSTPASPITKQIIYYSAGVGFALSPNTILDLAYSYQTDTMTDYYLYYADEYNRSGELISVNNSDLFSTKLNRHNVSLTLGFKF